MEFRYLQNITAIVDKDYHRCFIIPLNRSDVIPPHDFWDLVSKIGVSGVLTCTVLAGLVDWSLVMFKLLKSAL